MIKIGMVLLLLFPLAIACNWSGDLKVLSQVKKTETLAIMPSPKLSPVEERLLQANSQFGFELFSAIAGENRQQNLFISPTSVAIALSMLYNGAGGKTQEEMAAVLGIKDLSLADVNGANRSLRESLQNADSQVKLTIANSLWARKGVDFKPQFMKENRQFYDAQVASLDFANPETKTVINNWVSEKTNGKIEKIVEDISPRDILFLINAIYFKGIWTNEFDKKLTHEKPFYLVDGKQKQHPLMSRQGQYQYYENDQFQSVNLPYGEGPFSLYLFLPRSASNLETFLNQLKSENWQQWLSQFKVREGLLEMPRFKLEYEIKLNQALAALGMKQMFQDTANFSQMTAASVLVNEVKHKTFVEVNEEGTEAAAVTSIGIRATSIMPEEEPFKMIVNRPFFYAIRDNKTGTVLFMGTIFEPEEND